VLVLPGYLADDRSTRALRWFLRDRGYHAHAARLGRNFGPTPETVSGLVERLEALFDRHGRKVSLVGWSLGGIYARELARAFPDRVRLVITLASPFRDPTASTVGRLQRLGIGPRPAGAEPIRASACARTPRPDDVLLQRNRRHRRMADLPRGRGPVRREPRGAEQPLRDGPSPDGAARDRGPPRPARRRLASVCAAHVRLVAVHAALRAR
jgi:pimeloyl-ACP methyl ester carboxylesterase